MSRIEIKRGFTVIEVVLVLAIAGLIFLMVFIALPSLQRQSRDTQRRRDMETVISAIKSYQSNNRGALPDGNFQVWRDKLNKYLPNNFVSPSGGQYNLVVRECISHVGANCNTNEGNMVFDENNYIYIVKTAKCDGSKIIKSSNGRKVVVAHKLEGGGIFCGET